MRFVHIKGTTTLAIKSDWAREAVEELGLSTDMDKPLHPEVAHALQILIENHARELMRESEVEKVTGFLEEAIRRLGGGNPE
jgi:hypothetical protein